MIDVGSVASNNIGLAQGKARFAGLEFSGQYDFDSGLYSRLAYTWLPVAEQDAPFKLVSDNTIVNNSAKGNRQPYAPKNTLTAALGYKLGSWNAQLEAVHVGNQFADFAETETPTPGGDGQQGKIASYTIYNAALNYKYAPYKATFFVTGKNLFDKEYITDRTRGILTGMPRLVQVGARYDF